MATDAEKWHVRERIDFDSAQDATEKHSPSTHATPRIKFHSTGRKRLRKMIRKELHRLDSTMTWWGFIWFFIGGFSVILSHLWVTYFKR